MKNFIFIIVFSVILSVNAYAKKLNWKFEKSSQENELINCIKIIDVKSNRSVFDSVSTMGMTNETPFVVRLQNNCSEQIIGSYDIKFLDKDGFEVEKWFSDFKLPRKGIQKQTFRVLLGPIKWSKIKKNREVLLEFNFDISLSKELSKEIEAIKKIIYGQD
tara:strand:+ start:167 stop:649 length:483 start_codon:yes stop_codon:yes gene_type:complete